MKIGKTSYNVEACLALGKTEFKKQHKHLKADMDAVWDKLKNSQTTSKQEYAEKVEPKVLDENNS